MMNVRKSSLTALGVSLLAAVVLHGGAARAGDDRLPLPGDAPPRGEPTAAGMLAESDLDEAADDIPGELVVDARDDMDESAIASMLHGLGLSFTPTALEAETKEEIVDVPAGHMAEVMDELSHDPRVEGVEPLAKVHAFFVPDDPLFKE